MQDETKLEHINYFIKVMSLNGYSGTDIHKLLSTVEGENCLKPRRIQIIAKEFKDGREHVDRTLGSGRKTTSRTPQNIAIAQEMILENPLVSIRQIAGALGDLSTSIVFRLIHEDLGMSSVTARWLPHKLTENNLNNRVEGCRQLIDTFARRNMNQRLFVTDEKWVYCEQHPPACTIHKWVPCDAVGPEGDKPITARKTISAKKYMILVAANFSGMHYFEIMEDGGTINADRYILFLTNLIAYLDQNGMPAERVSLMHDNARPHTAGVTQRFLEESVISKVPQPPYSPDLNLMDRFIFRNMETARRNITFHNVNDLRHFVRNYLQSISVQMLNKEYNQLQSHFVKVIENGGEYLQ
jgi:transposase